MDIRGNMLDKIKIITPSYIDKNKRFDVILRFEGPIWQFNKSCRPRIP